MNMYEKKGDKKTKTSNHQPMQPGLGLALGGGMARGFTHIGVLKALERNGIRPSIVSGTSIGAVVGACYLAGKLAEFEEWALSLTRYKILSYLDLRIRSAGFIGGKHLEKLLHDHFGDLQIEDLPHPFIAIASDLITGHEVWIRKGSVVEAMRASFALPGVFPPVERNHRYLVDGALVNPLPTSATRSLGARMTISVDLHGDIIGKAAKPGQKFQTVAGFDLFDDKDVAPKEQKKLKTSMMSRLFRRETDSPSMFGVMISSLGIMMDRMTRARLAADPPDIHLKPQIGHIGLVEFEKAKDLIIEGEIAAERAMEEIMAAMEVFLPPQEHGETDADN